MKLAVLLPVQPDLGWLWRIDALAKRLASAMQAADRPFSLCFGVHKGANSKDVLTELSDMQSPFQIRSYQWEPVASGDASRMYPNLNFDFDGVATVHLPRDWGWNFTDCDVWIVCPDIDVGAILPVRPIFLYARSMSERYLPERHLSERQLSERHPPETGGGRDRVRRWTESMLAWRQAYAVFGAHQATLRDYDGFAGLWAHRNVLIDGLTPAPPSAECLSTYGRQPSANLLCLVDGADLDGVDAFIRAIIPSFDADQDMTICFGMDGIVRDNAGFKSAIAERLARRGLACGRRISIVEAFSNEDLTRLILRARLVVSLDRVAGEPDALIRALTLGRNYAGPSTPQALALAGEASPGVALWTRTEMNDMRASLARAWAAPAPQAPVAAAATSRGCDAALIGRFDECLDV